MRRLVILESPYSAPDGAGIAENLAYARACLRDSLMRGEAPLASHLLYTQEGVLNDNVPAQRELGIKAGLAWACAAQTTVVYVDLGISQGMKIGIADARRNNRTVEFRSLDNEAAA